jgi:putative ATP-dependent endonuclease of OLD family
LRTPFPKARVFGVSAERDVMPESPTNPQPVKAGGEGLTNLIRAFLYDSSLPMAEVEVGLLNDLNWVFESDTKFDRILCRQDQNGQWEIFLINEGSGAVRLSQSGSSLKSVFIMLAVIRLNPLIDRETNISNSVFYVEEPENNLHPSLLRRLLEYLDNTARDRDCSLIITTHSPTAIDWASRRANTSLFHVRRGADGAIVTAVKEYGATRRLLDDLDVRASEILQANGVIWVEGPTERIYLRKWIELSSAGQLVDGQHYSIMFYGGKLLSHLSCAAPGDDVEFIQLLRMNRNLALVMDSDRRRLPSGRFRSNINSTKKRILDEANEASGWTWLTDGKEIENYVSARVLGKIAPSRSLPGKFDSVPEAVGITDKVRLAEQAVDVTELDDLDTLDLRAQISTLCAEIRRWNKQA